jgi:hypothetical protein
VSAFPNDLGSYLITADDLGATLRVLSTVSVDNGAQHASAVAPSLEVGPVVLTVAGVKAALARMPVPSGRAISRRALLRQGGFRSSFTAPVAGRLDVVWNAARGPHHGQTLVAHATARFLHDGHRAFTVSLTGAGRKLLASSRPASLELVETFTPVKRKGTPGHGSTLRRRLNLSR